MAKNKNPSKNKIKEKRDPIFILPEKTKKWIGGVLMFLSAIIVAMSFFNLAGVAGKMIMAVFSFLIGKAVFVMPLLLIFGGLIFFNTRYKKFFWPIILAILVVIIGISGVFDNNFSSDLTPVEKGGWLGYIFSQIFSKLFGPLVTNIIFGVVIIIGSFIFWHLLAPLISKEEDGEGKKEEKKTLITKIFRNAIASPKFTVKEVDPAPAAVDKEKNSNKRSGTEAKQKAADSPFGFDEYQRPPLDLLDEERGLPSPGDIKQNSIIIRKTLENFAIPVDMSEVNIGPTVTQYTFKPADGIKLSKITGLANDLALSLAAHPLRIEAPIPGKSLVGIEIPNKVRAKVRLRDLAANFQFQNTSANLTIILGRDVGGNPVYADIARMPHLLVAGSTGTGKTIFLNNVIISLLYRNSPEILKFIFADPKRVEFHVYNKLPHLLCPVILDAQRVVNAVKWLIWEMERRFDVLAQAGTRDIKGYNEIAVKEKEPFLPYIVLVIDELADLMAARGKDIEAGIVRLAQMARAVGIHLVVATQRPSVEVITGLIKANITSRVTFQVASQVDSRTVLDMAGAEKLLGAGDLLFISAENAKPKRIQAAYVSEKEVKRIVNWIVTKNKAPDLQEGSEILENSMAINLEKSLDAPAADSESNYDGDDSLYEEAKKVVIDSKKASASLLQRRLRIGYARAARLIDMLEEQGIVGPADGAKPREILANNSGEEFGEGEKKDEWQNL